MRFSILFSFIFAFFTLLISHAVPMSISNDIMENNTIENNHTDNEEVNPKPICEFTDTNDVLLFYSNYYKRLNYLLQKAKEKKIFKNLNEKQYGKYFECYDDFAYYKEREKRIKKNCPETYVNPPVDKIYEDLKSCNEKLNKAEGLKNKLVTIFN